MFRFPAASSAEPNLDGDRDPSVATRVVRIFLIMGVLLGAIVAAVAIAVPGGGHRSDGTAHASLAALRTEANKQWASATCTNILAWKKQLARDETGLLGLSALAHINDGIAATKRMLTQEDKLGLPPGAQTAQARAEASRLRTEIERRVKNIESVASSVAGGDIGALGTLLSDLQSDKAMGPQVVDELRHVLSVDLGLSLAETSACRQLIGIPI